MNGSWFLDGRGAASLSPDSGAEAAEEDDDFVTSPGGTRKQALFLVSVAASMSLLPLLSSQLQYFHRTFMLRFSCTCSILSYRFLHAQARERHINTNFLGQLPLGRNQVFFPKEFLVCRWGKPSFLFMLHSGSLICPWDKLGPVGSRKICVFEGYLSFHISTRTQLCVFFFTNSVGD